MKENVVVECGKLRAFHVYMQLLLLLLKGKLIGKNMLIFATQLRNLKKHMLLQLLRCPERINGCKVTRRKYIRLLSNAYPDDPKKIELKHRMSLKEGTSVCGVVSTDTVQRRVRIPHLKVLIKVKHPRLKGVVARIQNHVVALEFRRRCEKSHQSSWSF